MKPRRFRRLPTLAVTGLAALAGAAASAQEAGHAPTPDPSAEFHFARMIYRDAPRRARSDAGLHPARILSFPATLRRYTRLTVLRRHMIKR